MGRAPRRSSGSTTLISATRATPTWRMSAWLTSGNSCASGGGGAAGGWVGFCFLRGGEKEGGPPGPRPPRPRGVFYAPPNGLFGNSAPPVPPRRYDAFLYID